MMKLFVLKLKVILLIVIFTVLCVTANLFAGELLIGTAIADITPSLPVALNGQFELRIANSIETPLTASVLVLESINDNRSSDATIMVSCDMVGIPIDVINRVREEVHKLIPEIDVKKIILTATHTHTAPVLENDLNSNFRYNIPSKGVLQPNKYKAFLIHNVTEAIIKAWKNRRSGSISWGLSHASVAYNRRAVYADGNAKMYGVTNIPEFLNLEGTEDHDVDMLFCWNKDGKLIAMTIDIACPAQEVENRSAVNADYWYPVREKLKQQFGSDLCVLGWIGAAGDQSTRPIYRKAAEERMIKLRNINRIEEISRRIVQAVDEAYETVKGDRYSDVLLIHKVETLSLPMRLVTEEECASAKVEQDKATAQISANPEIVNQVLANMTWNRDVVNRFNKQKMDKHPQMDAELHVIRIGNVVVCTNGFELFTDYGIRIKARSNALQTFIVQLAGPDTYLPTEKAVNGGGYSAIIQSDLIDPEGGQILVNRTVDLINEMFTIEE